MTNADTRLYGKATVQTWNRLHPRLTSRAAWADHKGPLPIIEGTVIRLRVEHLPSGGVNKPVWLWWSGVDATPADVDRCWHMFLRRFDIEHTFRLFKQTLGWTRPGCGTQNQLTGGPGWSSPSTPNCVWPGHWSPTCAARGNAPPNQSG